MKVELALYLDVDFYELEDSEQAVAAADKTNRSVYTWKTSGLTNWMERRISNVDALGLVLLPRGMPDCLDMPEDPEDDAL